MPDTIEVTGLVELARSVSLLGPAVRKEFRAALAEGGGLVASKGQQLAAGEGLEASGDLIRKIKVAVLGSSTVVLVREAASRVSAKYPSGYVYPAIYEFSRDRKRPFLIPALDDERPAVLALVEARIARLISNTFTEGSVAT